MIDWKTIVITVLGLLTGAGGVTSLFFFRQNKNSHTADATDKWIDIFKKQNDLLGDSLDLKTKQVLDYERKLEENRKEISGLKYEQLNIIRRQKGTEREIESLKKRSEHAEYYYCSVVGCMLRKPTLGTYKPKEIE